MKINDKVHVRFYDIDWDDDGEGENLPTETEHDFSGQELYKGGYLTKDDVDEEFILNYDLIDDLFGDWLSDEYGFCVNSFRTEIK